MSLLTVAWIMLIQPFRLSVGLPRFLLSCDCIALCIARHLVLGSAVQSCLALCDLPVAVSALVNTVMQISSVFFGG